MALPRCELDQQEYEVVEEKKSPEKDIDDNLSLYQKQLAEVNQQTEGMTPLHKHIWFFLDKENHITAEALRLKFIAMGSSQASLKANAVSFFNKVHSGHCPWSEVLISRNENLSAFLHLGTMRVWNADGSFNEESWKRFVNFITALNPKHDNKVKKSEIDAYLQHCAANDPQDLTNGRNTNSWFSAKPAQVFAATQAWAAALEVLSCGWENDQPLYTLEILREFFENTPAAFLRAECHLLPVAKPGVEAPRLE